MTIKERAIGVYNQLGLPLTLVLIVATLALLWFAYGGVMNAYDSYVTSKQIENLKREADALREQAKQAEVEKEQFKGAAAAYKQQAEQVQNELTELINARPELQKQVSATSRKVEEIRNRKPVPVTDNMVKRVDDVGAKLDALYP